MIAYAVDAIVILILVFLIVRWIKLPATIEQRRLAAEESAKRQAEKALKHDQAVKERQEARQERWDRWRNRKKPTK